MIGPHFAAGVKILMYDDHEIPIFKGQGHGLAAGSHIFAGTKVVLVGSITRILTIKYFEICIPVKAVGGFNYF